MSRGKIVNLALVGCGGIAGGHLRRYGELIDSGEDRFRIVATVDSDISRAQAYADQINGKTGWEVNCYPSVEDLLNSESDLDGADICSPHGLHHVLACELLEGGVNILCEKPIGITVKATQKNYRYS